MIVLVNEAGLVPVATVVVGSGAGVMAATLLLREATDEKDADAVSEGHPSASACVGSTATAEVDVTIATGLDGKWVMATPVDEAANEVLSVGEDADADTEPEGFCRDPPDEAPSNRGGPGTT